MSDLAVGQTIRINDGPVGTIRFVGQTRFAPGEWVGVELDEGRGKNDGSVQGERYFDCPMGHGMFVRPVTVTVLAQPAAKPAPAAVAAARKGGRPSSMFTAGSTRGSSDQSAGKRRSLNAPSPSPGPRTSRPSSITRSPTKSPTKPSVTASSSGSTSRTGTPSNARAASTTVKGRPTLGAGRTSMGPPAAPATRTARQSSVSSTVSRSSTGQARTLSGRASLAPSTKPASARSASTRQAPGAASSTNENGSAASGTSRTTAGSSQKSDDEILSPQPTNPVQAKTMALERLTRTSPTATRKTSSTTAGAASSSGTASASAATAPRPAASNNTSTAPSREVEDLKAKLRVLERKRVEDRDKLKTMDKIQGERDKFEAIIQKLQSKYQPQQQENNELKKQLKEAEARLETVEAIQADHDSAMELAAVDREMAEETAEVLKTELEALKQKSDELELEVEILREENAEYSKGMSPEERASTGWLQMERNNERLREALLRLRDLTHQQEGELRDQIRSLEEDVAEYAALKAEHALSAERLGQAESTIEDLRQQLDTALGAEDMIEDLTERNMSQSEQIEELKAVVEDLENLRDVNDELEINHVQNEKEMQEEIDFKDSVVAEQARRAAQQEEALEDMEYTLSRFRELVTSLQGDLEDMRASHAVTESESEQLSSRSRAMMDLNMKLQISAAKAQVKAIDMEMRRLDAQEAEQHLSIVQLFLPDSYSQAADRDSVLALLRFRRLAAKANLLNGFLKERVNGQPHPGHEDDVLFGCDAVDKLTWVAAMCGRFVSSISHCSLDDFARYQGALDELEPVERALNAWIDGLRRDDLKEAQCADELQRTMALMTHLAEVHMAPDLRHFADDVHMKTQLVQTHLESAAVAFTTVKNMASLAGEAAGAGQQGQDGSSGSDTDDLAQYFARKADAAVSQTRSAKVVAGKALRALEDLRTRSLSLMPDTLEAFEQAETASRDIAQLARAIGLDLHALLHEEGRTEPYTLSEIQDCALQTASRVGGASESDGLFSTYLGKLRLLTAQISDLFALSSDLAQTQEFDRPVAPWILRSRELKALKTVPVDAEEELRRLRDDYNEARRAVGLHEEKLSVAHLKIDTLESRMRDANAKTSRIAELEAQIAHAAQHAAGLGEDIEKQDRELKALEADRDKWKKVAGDSRLLGPGGVGAGGGAGANGEPGSGAASGQERAVATARQMDALKAEIASLQSAVRHLRDDNRRARLAEQPAYDWLAEPLCKPPPPQAQKRALVAAEARDALGELVRMVGSPDLFYDLASLPRDKLAWKPARTTPQYHAAKQMEDFAAWSSWHDSVLNKSQLLLGRPVRRGGGAEESQQHQQHRRLRVPAATLQIRLPRQDGKLMSGTGATGGVQIVGSAEWEGLQGRLAAV